MTVVSTVVRGAVAAFEHAVDVAGIGRQHLALELGLAFVGLHLLQAQAIMLQHRHVRS